MFPPDVRIHDVDVGTTVLAVRARHCPLFQMDGVSVNLQEVKI